MNSPDGFIIPKAMSTQHPDNAFLPSFAAGEEVLKGEDEITEADFVFSTLGCDEQMWDYEGKGADIDVVMKLLVAHPSFFRKHRLGKDVFLTIRIPNPSIEGGMRKRAQEALHNITTSFDLAKQFYSNTDHAPIFEVILPLTTSAEEAHRVYQYYQSFVARSYGDGQPIGIPLGEWLGESQPKRINVISLFEDRASLLHIDELVGDYLSRLESMGQMPSHLRVFLARSDPALNYGLLSATLLNKVALQRLGSLEQTSGTTLYPIIGVGGVPFRGNFRPGFVDSVLEEYPSVQTFSIQSSFKFDNMPGVVKTEIQKIKNHVRAPASQIDEERAIELMDRYTTLYQQQVERLAPFVNSVAPLIPRRRDRRLHIGLYGYSRSVGEPIGNKAIQLPRAIGFCASLYSLGIPPELLGLGALSKNDVSFLETVYPHFINDIVAAGHFVNEDNFRNLLDDETLKSARPYLSDIDREHKGLTSLIADRVETRVDDVRTKGLIGWAAETRRFLG